MLAARGERVVGDEPEQLLAFLVERGKRIETLPAAQHLRLAGCNIVEAYGHAVFLLFGQIGQPLPVLIPLVAAHMPQRVGYARRQMPDKQRFAHFLVGTLFFGDKRSVGREPGHSARGFGAHLKRSHGRNLCHRASGQLDNSQRVFRHFIVFQLLDFGLPRVLEEWFNHANSPLLIGSDAQLCPALHDDVFSLSRMNDQATVALLRIHHICHIVTIG